ncbi:MAG TPA: D-inositol-3-phosphate glycosyltransferase [Jatrophihabitantaceae bacterium]|jgi:D-inositol-3-phosphate glycosyltransferase|nr:D-inositol-3-phosphate glycosyltransferase [Jatrophihabitantaceae bacterium]
MSGSLLPRRVAMLSVHTSPLDSPGSGDAGGLNVYVSETAKRLADAGVAVEIFTRATASDQPSAFEMHPDVLVRHVTAGPYGDPSGLSKADLPAQLCAFTASVLRAEAYHEPGWYDLIHSHYWLSGQVGWLARERWGVPLVHTAHTLGKVKNAALAEGDAPEPLSRIVGEEQVVAEADRLVASTEDEARELVEHYGADPRRIDAIPPGVDLATFTPGPGLPIRDALGIAADALVLLYVGRIQPLKAPDVLLRAAAALRDSSSTLAAKLHVVVIGAPSGSGMAEPKWLERLADDLNLGESVHFVAPVARAELAAYYRAADLTVVPSYNESFGLVALESQACGVPVVAAGVGGLPTAVGEAGLLVNSHRIEDWALALKGLLESPGRRAELAGRARAHAEEFSWERTTRGLLISYSAAIDDLARRPAIQLRRPG